MGTVHRNKSAILKKHSEHIERSTVKLAQKNYIHY